jgi:hypothetical protein
MSEIRVNKVVNSTGDNDSGLDMTTNDQVLIKTANTTAVTVDSSQNVTNSGNLTVAGNLTVSGTATGVGGGKVLQMPFTQYTGTTQVTTGANTNVALSVLTVNITPSSTSSIIRIDGHVFHEWDNSSATFNCVWFFYRDTTKLAIPQAGNRLSGISTTTQAIQEANSTPEVVYYSYFDSPSSTSQITYKVGVINHYSTSVWINRTKHDASSTEYERGLSFISATEIGA